MRVLIAYGTIEGHSRKVAEWMADRVRSKGHNCRMTDVSALDEKHNIADQDALIVIAPVHQRTHPETVVDWICAYRISLNEKPSAFVSVSLSAAFDAGQTDATAYVKTLLQSTGWKPVATHLVAGALRYDEYDYFKEQIVRHLVLKNVGGTEAKGDHEFTDWSKLGRFLDQFLASTNSGKEIGLQH